MRSAWPPSLVHMYILLLVLMPWDQCNPGPAHPLRDLLILLPPVRPRSGPKLRLYLRRNLPLKDQVGVASANSSCQPVDLYGVVAAGSGSRINASCRANWDEIQRDTRSKYSSVSKSFHLRFHLISGTQVFGTLSHNFPLNWKAQAHGQLFHTST